MSKHFKIIALLAFAVMSSKNVSAASCVIDRLHLADPAMSWDNRDSVGDLKASQFKVEQCEAPQGSIITNVRVNFGYYTNPNILANGLIWGNYGMTVSAGGVQASTTDTVISGVRPRSIESGSNLSAFNGMELNRVKFNVYSKVTNYSVDLECNHLQSEICKNFMSASYKLTIDYDAPAAIPSSPSQSQTIIDEFNQGITLMWSPVSEADYYEIDTHFIDSTLNTASTSEPHRYISYSPKMTWRDNKVSNRQFRIRACNSAGCSADTSIVSGK
ncbi:hypothetical protein [Alteromonas sp. a30]|uniref:hypothetical protein n=1 Tax=Alteromonas sp. a30 TaxID=2730917 RepID=UPI002282F4DF|nr:hypothetical protein [Alteromonas sp. a30]MCY7296265.1 hypothetical protein [Alteromonas sp. a30]